MIWAIAAFELRKRRSQLSSYVYFLMFFAIGLMSMLAAGGAFSGVSVGAGSERIHANAPVVVGALIGVMTNLGVLVSAAVFGQAVHQDYENHAGLVFFTLPISKGTYLGGRFLGALLFSLTIFSSIGLGQWIGSLFPVLVNRELFGPTPFTAYVIPYCTTVLPNLIFTGGVFFALATLTRRMMPVYVGAVLVSMGYLLAMNLLHDVENKTLAALLDPLGFVASSTVTRYWTVIEKNTRTVPLTGLFFWNRLIWSSVGLAALAFTWVRFELMADSRSQGKERATASEPLALGATLSPSQAPTYGGLATLTIAWRLTKLGFVETVKNTYFGIFALAGAILTIAIAPQIGKAFGTATYPVTGIVVKSFESVAGLFVLIIVTFYAGELAWRERDNHFDQIADALPVPTWVPYVAKLVSLCLAPAMLLGVVTLSGMAYQTALGYHHYELGLYLRWMYEISLPGYLFLCVLALTVQSVVQNKYVGHFAMIAFYVFQLFQDKLGLERRLWKYGDLPSVTYSDMNGFGHFLRPLAFYDLYWGGVAVILVVVGDLFWTRGTETSFRTRLSIARARISVPVAVAGVFGILVAGATGGFIYYNSDVPHDYRSDHTMEEDRAAYEKLYKRFEDVAQPRITAVKVLFDVYPEDEALHVHGTYTLENKTDEAIPTIYLELPSHQKFKELRIGTVAAPTESDVLHGRYTFLLETPMKPHETLPVEFDLRLQESGFGERGNRTDLAENGTFVNSFHLPHLGYAKDSELANDNERKKYGLAPKERMADLDDPKALARNYVTGDSDWVTFDATVSTTEGQIGVAPGYLDREWAVPGPPARHYFHYTMDAPILDFFSVLSARYAVMKDSWNGVSLEIYYHPGHEYDLEEMMKGMKLALAYDSEAFGPYQYRQARILEFPAYASFAQSFPNTIPYSESIGFIAKVDRTKDDDIDYPLYVTAHEISHQWWAHQVVGGNVQGATVLSETLAQYSSLMVMKKEVGEKEMRRFLKYELDRYLSGRGFEQKKEVPLMRAENQAYIHYDKGSIVMYALQDYVGEENVNRALRAFVDRWKQKGPPYPNARALVDELRRVTPPDLQYLIHDFFETITLYENRTTSATAKKLPDGKYEITLEINAKKVEAGDQGEEKEVPMNDLISVGAVDDKKAPIFLTRRRLPSGDSEVKFTVDTLPAKAGIDPLNELIDRHPDDNLASVTLE